MPGKSSEEESDAQLLSEAMRAIRKYRRLRPSEMARRLGMPIRSYEHFEAGRGKISLHRIRAFAEVTDSDPVALLASVLLKKPELALYCADNKFLTIMLHAMDEFEADLGPDIAYLSPGTAIGAFTRVAKDLADLVRKRDTFAEHWLEQRGTSAHDGPGAVEWRRKKPK